MIEYLIKGIAEAIGNEFENARIYVEELKQGFKEPCFFIRCISRSHELFMGKRYFRRNSFCISYFPENSLSAKQECHSIAEKLMLCLENIFSDGLLTRGKAIHYEIEDGILHFFIEYNGFVNRVDEKDKMEDLTTVFSLKKKEKENGESGNTELFLHQGTVFKIE